MIESDPEKAHLTARGPVDLIIVNATAKGFDGLRFAAQIRSDEATRHLPILGVVDPDDRARLVKALEIGFNDVLARPIDPQELAARVKKPDQAASATPTSCATTSTIPWSWRSPIRSPACTTAATWTGQLGALVEPRRCAAASRWPR